ncbi:MAG TPA: hypothetical protein VJN94_10875 [Candidatus Binataceae bacterium]|nr:hypothetical protein [Candidatus Binataceae bacterium]
MQFLKQLQPILTVLFCFAFGFESARHMHLGIEDALYFGMLGIAGHTVGLAQQVPSFMKFGNSEVADALKRAESDSKIHFNS